MTRALLDHVIWDMGQAFDVLFNNLKDLHEDDWDFVPDGGARSIRDIVGHVAAGKLMNENHAFGDGSMTWEDPRLEPGHVAAASDGSSPEALVDWLRASDVRLRRSVDALIDDAELAKPRPVHWGGARKTRWIIARLIEHDAFHAGEINHLRSVHQRNDRWEWEQEQ